MPPTEWEEQLRDVAARSTPDQENQFLALVDSVEGKVTGEVAKVLMTTFSAIPDHGTQERVCSILAGAPSQVQVSAILGEMPRLIVDAPDWAESLLAELLEHQASALRISLASATPQTRLAVRTIALRDDFLNCSLVRNQSMSTAAKSLYNHRMERTREI